MPRPIPTLVKWSTHQVLASSHLSRHRAPDSSELISADLGPEAWSGLQGKGRGRAGCGAVALEWVCLAFCSREPGQSPNVFPHRFPRDTEGGRWLWPVWWRDGAGLGPPSERTVTCEIHRPCSSEWSWKHLAPGTHTAGGTRTPPASFWGHPKPQED